MNLLLCACWLISSGAVAGAQFPPAEEVFAARETSAVSGNGALTVCVNRFGQVTVCRWPSPSYYNQVRVEMGSGEAGRGLMWAIRTEAGTSWLGGEPWRTTQNYTSDESTVVETVCSLPDSPLTATQYVFVHPLRDILVARFEIRGLEKRPEVYWFANFSPCTRLMPELPVADWALDACNDFAVFTPDNGKTVYHFRPRKPGSSDWEKAESLAARRALGAEWTSFEEGVWIAYSSPERVSGFQCGTDDDVASAFVQAGSGLLGGSSVAVGQCNSAISIVPVQQEDTYVANVMISLGKSRTEADANLDYASERGYEVLREEAEQHWKNRLRSAVLPATDDPVIQTRCKRNLLTIIQCTDRDTGAIVRSPVVRPPLALDWPRHGAWITLALDLAGYRELAEKHTLFYTKAVRAKGERGKPFGSMPGALYANHVEGLPHLMLEADAVAWMLASFWRHASFLEGQERRAYLTKVRDAVDGSVEFLVGWADGRTREPLHSFDPYSWKDARSPKLLLTTYMGVDSALRITDALGQARPQEWSRRKRELAALIRFHCVDETGAWKLGDIAPFWQEEIAETELPPWDDVIERRLVSLEELDGFARARLFCDAAMTWHGRPEKLESLALFLRSAPAGNSPTRHDAFIPDALKAALEFVAASIIYASYPH